MNFKVAQHSTDVVIVHKHDAICTTLAEAFKEYTLGSHSSPNVIATTAFYSINQINHDDFFVNAETDCKSNNGVASDFVRVTVSHINSHTKPLIVEIPIKDKSATQPVQTVTAAN